MLSVYSRSRLFCLEPEPNQFGRSRSRLWDLKTAGAAQKSGGSATLDSRLINKTQVPDPRSMDPKAGRIRIGI